MPAIANTMEAATSNGSVLRAPTPMATNTPGTAITPEPAKKGLGNAYLWMLILSLVFLAIGCAMLVVELGTYNFQLRPV